MAVRGRAGTAGMVNGNRRLYPDSVYRKIVRAFESPGSGSESGALLGELDHPAAAPRLEKTALRITALQLDESGRLNFQAHVLDTPHGRTLAQLIRAGVPVSVSTRGEGTLGWCCPDHEAAEEPGRRVPSSFPRTAHRRGEHSGRFSDRADHLPHRVVRDDYTLLGIDAVVRGAHAGASIAGVTARREEEVGRCTAGCLSIEERKDNMPVITEESGNGEPAEEMAGRVAALEGELKQAQSDLDVLQAAASAERAAVARTVEGLQDQIEIQRAEYEARLSESQKQLDESAAARDQALTRLQKILVEEQTSTLLSNLRPDVRKKIAEQLAACQSPAEVAERWHSIEQLLSAAGFTNSLPAGAGFSDNAEALISHSSLTPEQRLQQRLLANSF